MKLTNQMGGLRNRCIGVVVAAAVFLALMPMAEAQEAGTEGYVALGDSISSGYGLEEEGMSFPQQVARDNGLELTNLAQNGETSASLLDKLDIPQTQEAVARADVITITVGGNDLMNALYDYLTQQYNQENPDVPTTQEHMKQAVMGGDEEMLLFALGVASGFPQSAQATQALAAFETNLTQIVQSIRRENGQAQLVVVEQYNPYSYLGRELSQNPLFARAAQRILTVCETGVQGINRVIATVGAQGDCGVARIYDTFEGTQENPCNASVSVPVSVNLDFHPNAYGHHLIAQQVTALLGQPAPTPQQTQRPQQEVETAERVVPTGDDRALAAWVWVWSTAGAGLAYLAGRQRRRKAGED